MSSSSSVWAASLPLLTHSQTADGCPQSLSILSHWFIGPSRHASWCWASVYVFLGSKSKVRLEHFCADYFGCLLAVKTSFSFSGSVEDRQLLNQMNGAFSKEPMMHYVDSNRSRSPCCHPKVGPTASTNAFGSCSTFQTVFRHVWQLWQTSCRCLDSL